MIGLAVQYLEAPIELFQKHQPGQAMGQRQLGGLGIYLVIKKAESVAYEYTNGENVFTVSLQTNKTVKSCF